MINISSIAHYPELGGFVNRPVMPQRVERAETVAEMCTQQCVIRRKASMVEAAQVVHHVAYLRNEEARVGLAGGSAEKGEEATQSLW